MSNKIFLNQVRPLSDGDVTVSLIDVCLEAEAPVSSTIKVSGGHKDIEPPKIAVSLQLF